MQSARLTPLDATFLELEDADVTAHMHIGATLVFHPRRGGRAPSVHELRAAIEPRLPALPLYRCRLSEPTPGLLHWPHWVEDDGLRPRRVTSRKLRFRLPADASSCTSGPPATGRERLERDRPLWEMTLVTGLEGGCWAICTKTHHCLVDGVGSVDAAYLLLDTRAGRAPRPSRRRRSPTTANGHAASAALPGAVAHGARAGIDAALHPSKLLDALARSRAMAELVARDELVAAPRTSLNIPIGVHRRFDVVRVPLADVKLIKNRLGGTVNDVVLAAATAGLRELLVARGEEPPRGRPPSDGPGQHQDRRGQAREPDQLALRAPAGRGGESAPALRPLGGPTPKPTSPAHRLAAARRSSGSPVSRRRSSTPSWRARCSPRGSSTSRSRTCPARSSRCTRAARG